MNFPPPNRDNDDDFFAKEKLEFAEIDFSALLDFPALSPSFLPKIETGEKYLVFHLDEKLYGICTDKILEIAASLPVTPIPNLSGWLMGIANLRGMLISVVNLRRLWRKPDYSSQKSKLIVFQPAENDISIAFMVDKVSEIVTIPPAEISFPSSDFENSFPTFFGKTVFKSQPLFLLDIEKTLSTLKLDNFAR